MSIRFSWWFAVIALSVSAATGCGGARGGGASSAGATSGQERSATTGGSSDDTLPLDPPVAVPGTGVTLRAPRGSEPVPFGAGFVHRARRIQMLIAAARGDADVMAGFERGIASDAEPVSTEEVEVAGRAVTLHVDRQETGQDLLLERVWVLVREGDRAFVVAGAYDASRSERVRDLVRASVLSAEWDGTATLDPEAAVGFQLRAPDGLSLDRSTTSSITYGVEGQMVPPQLGAPTLFLIAVPAQVPLAQRDDACEPILFQAGPVPDDHVRTRGRIETDEVEGCEVTGWQENDGPDGEAVRLATYAAIVYLADETLLVAGVVAEGERDAWMARFAEAARTVSRAR